MSQFWIALRSIQQRGVSSGLTIFSMALGVMLVVLVLSIHGVVQNSFQTNASLGYNVLTGAKGGQEQLVLNMVYYLAAPVENVPYDYYLEYLNKDQRDKEIANSYAYHNWLAQKQMNDLQAAMSDGSLAALAQQELAAAELKRMQAALQLGREGKYAPYCTMVIPVCLGDFYGQYRVVGTTPDFFDMLVYKPETGAKYEFAQGKNFVQDDPDHGYFGAVVGSTVAREMNVKVGDKINPAHGAPEGHTHQKPFTVVGILKPSGTPNDRAVFVNMEGFYLMEDHAKPLEAETLTGEKVSSGDEMTEEEKKAAEDEKQSAVEARQKERESAEAHDEEVSLVGIPPLPMEQREVTGMLVLTSNALFAPGLKNSVNEGKDAQVVFPVEVITRMFAFFIDPIRWAFIALTSMICGVSGLSILISMYNSMSERRHEIAVMRALGAGRDTVFMIILWESVLLALGGGFVGWFLGHLGCWLLSPEVEQRTGVSIGFWNWEPSVELTANLSMPAELLIIPALLLLAIIVGIWPAMSAYRTDVAQSLGK